MEFANFGNFWSFLPAFGFWPLLAAFDFLAIFGLFFLTHFARFARFARLLLLLPASLLFGAFGCVFGHFCPILCIFAHFSQTFFFALSPFLATPLGAFDCSGCFWLPLVAFVHCFGHF